MDAAETREWNKWNEFGVTKFLSKKQLNDIMKRNPDQKIVGTRLVFTEKVIQGKPDYKARLVVQGCQEDKGHIRTDAPTGSRDAFFLTLSAAAQSGWDYSVFDASQRTSSQTASRDCCCCGSHTKNPPPGTKPGPVYIAIGSIYGRETLGLSCTVMSMDSGLVAFKKGLQEIQGCFATSCARAPFEATVGHGRALWLDHLQRCQSHQGDANQINAEPGMYEHRSGIANTGKRTHER